ncbi:MAG: UDP-N-acetylmuramoyl-L-alanyl-D-glutamate--2,6-diaminopimelate ligase [Alphaproteobacteria bacterium]
MKLRDLMKEYDIKNLPDIEIGKVTSDTRKIQKGDIFVAIKGTQVDGHDYIDEAIAKGASAIIADESYHLREGIDIPIISSSNSRESLAKLSGLLWNNIPETKLAVTGTNGKSSVAGFVAQIMEMHQKPTLVLGTLGIYLNGKKLRDSLTTPDSVILHQTLEWAKTQGAEAVSLEASSHGLEQNRLDGLAFDVAAFTNLSRDHLDYHGNMEDYLKAKCRLFEKLLKKQGCAVINSDDEAAKKILKIVQKRGISAVTYGSNATLRIQKITPQPQGQEVTFDHMGENHHIFLPLIGRFQVENAACSALMAMAAGIGTQAIDDLSQLKGITGRMEYIGQSPKGGSIYVDYAHTPDGLATALQHARPHTRAHLNVVFGAGGDRDKGKRPLMGKAAYEHADKIYITDDNPRGEDAAFIREQVASQAPNATNIAGRKQAIEQAIDELDKDDILIVAGKGHESGQIVGSEVLAFNDGDVIREMIGK